MAVRQVNMLPHDVLERSVERRLIRFWSRWVIVVLLVMLGVNLGCRQWVRIQEQSFSPGGAAGMDVSAKLEQIKAVNDEIRSLQEKGETLARIVRRQTVYDAVALFSNCLNDRTWIEVFSISRDKEAADASVLECRGVSVDHNALGSFIDKLSKVPRVKQVVLREAGSRTGKTAVQQDYPGAVRFAVSCVMERQTAL